MPLKVLSPDELTDQVAVLVGTRPGIIKFAPIIRAFIDEHIHPLIIHAGQHYTYELDRIFFEELNLPAPSHRVQEMDKTFYHGEQTAHMLAGIERVLLEEKPRALIVGGDANTNLAGALAARKLGINLVHLEAGLRSNDWRMPEEHNRVIIDHISEVLLAPTNEAMNNLRADAVKGKIFFVGNTISDSVAQNKIVAEEKSSVLDTLDLKRGKFILFTMHREENVDSNQIVTAVCEMIETIANDFLMDIVFPIHPRTANRLKALNISFKNKRIKNTKPLGYFDFLKLLSNCSVAITDSGGVQEEACILGVPCLTIRENTERPETVTIGANKLVGHNQERLLQELKYIFNHKRPWNNPYGKDVGKKIVNIMQKEFLGAEQ
jgi:UDP-N-acetylglucosamine 2-epimerase (non-hydrolysing)